jgi:hypothetical protein
MISTSSNCNAPQYPFIDIIASFSSSPKEIDMARGEKKGNRETKKPKKKKEIAAAPSQKPGGWQPSAAPGKKK